MTTSQRHLLHEMLAAFFDSCDESLLDAAVSHMQWTSLQNGEILFHQGEPGSSIGFVVAGRLEASITAADGSARAVGQLARGEVVGEIAFFLGERRTATVRAVRDTVIAMLSRSELDQLMAHFPGLAMDMARRIIDRLTGRERHATARVRLRTLGLIPHDPRIDLESFGRRLELSLLRFGSTSYLDHRTVRTMLGADCGPGAADDADFDLRLNTLLDRHEVEHDFVLLQADPSSPQWTRKCLHQADKILIVARAGASPELGPLEAAMAAEPGLRPSAGIDLVLLHPDASVQPSGTASWLEPRSLGRHHHVPWRGNSGFNRLARFIADRTVALVLAGGGARGFAHIGAIRAIREAGIPVDAVGGTSIGGMVGSLVALDWSDEKILAQCQRAFADEKPLDDYTVPIIAITRGEKLQRSLRRYFGGTAIEDMWLPFFAVSANLSRNCVVVHDRGPLWLALRATASLPGILPPVVHHGDLLIDGGVLNNLPIDIMKERFRGHTVAVDLGVDVDFTTDRDTMPSPYELLRSRMLPFSEPIAAPTIMSVIVKTATLGRTELGEEDVDLYLNPPLQGFELLDWQRIHSLVDAGYRYTRERLAAWPGATRLIQRDELFDSRGISGIARRFP